MAGASVAAGALVAAGAWVAAGVPHAARARLAITSRPSTLNRVWRFTDSPPRDVTGSSVKHVGGLWPANTSFPVGGDATPPPRRPAGPVRPHRRTWEARRRNIRPL